MYRSTHFPSAAALTPWTRIAARLLAAYALCVSTPQLRAGTVDSFLGWSSGVASVAFDFINTPAPNNDDVAGPSSNVIRITQKNYVHLGPVDLLFSVVPSGGVTEYILSEGVANSTGVDWTDYHLQLGFGTGASFVPSVAGDGLDFDAPSFNTPADMSVFTSVTVTEDGIDGLGGVYPAGYFDFFNVPIDVPDGIEQFTVRQYPTRDFVPEPGSWILALLAGGIGMAMYRRATP
jgi:PEP-CTERM motif